MEDINSNTSIVAAVCTLLGISIPVIAKFVIDYVRNKHHATKDELTIQFTEIREERNDLIARSKAVTDDLQKQIFDLRTMVVDLQQKNLNYMQENADLKAQVFVLTQENKTLTKRVAELETELHGRKKIPPQLSAQEKK
jgi:uncharacterized coiled-coil DUF342 family protein